MIWYIHIAKQVRHIRRAISSVGWLRGVPPQHSDKRTKGVELTAQTKPQLIEPPLSTEGGCLSAPHPKSVPKIWGNQNE